MADSSDSVSIDVEAISLGRKVSVLQSLIEMYYTTSRATFGLYEFHFEVLFCFFQKNNFFFEI